MAITKDLFLSILSMDAYNRGYKPGLAGLDDTSGGSASIGNATISFNLADANIAGEAQAISFYGLAYTIGAGVDDIASGTTVISYRGTDHFWQEFFQVDLPMSFLGAYERDQDSLASALSYRGTNDILPAPTPPQRHPQIHTFAPGEPNPRHTL